MMAIERIGAGLASQSGMVGPMATIALGALLLDEPFTVWVAAGTAFVIIGIFVFAKAPRP
jgi:drug/metabolite transporter (DMT)-like permease